MVCLYCVAVYVALTATDELLDLHRGQGIELYWREHLHCPTEEEYVSMVNNSVSSLCLAVLVLSARKKREACSG